MTDIVFSCPRRPNLISRVISVVTKSPASHCAFSYWDNDFECEMILEADFLGFVIIPRDKWDLRNRTIATAEGLDIDSGLSEVARKFLGTRYDYAGAIGTLFSIVGRLIKVRLSNPLHDARAVFCSEAAVLALQHVRFPKSDMLIAADTTPADLLRFFSHGPSNN